MFRLFLYWSCPCPSKDNNQQIFKVKLLCFQVFPTEADGFYVETEGNNLAKESRPLNRHLGCRHSVRQKVLFRLCCPGGAVRQKASPKNHRPESPSREATKRSRSRLRLFEVGLWDFHQSESSESSKTEPQLRLSRLGGALGASVWLKKLSP